jgi:hypothetical protein
VSQSVKYGAVHCSTALISPLRLGEIYCLAAAHIFIASQQPAGGGFHLPLLSFPVVPFTLPHWFVLREHYRIPSVSAKP